MFISLKPAHDIKGASPKSVGGFVSVASLKPSILPLVEMGILLMTSTTATPSQSQTDRQ